MIAFMIPFFIWIKFTFASPLGTYIKVCILCDETGQPVAPGLRITIATPDGSTQSALTDVDGCTGWMGSGFTEGTYVITFYWNEEYRFEETIDCSQQEWVFTYRVPNPIIHKTFLYDLPGAPPVVGLRVELHDANGLIQALFTDASGMVTFDGSLIEVCKDYWLKWTWNSIPGEEGPIHFGYDADGRLPECEISLTNYLEPKSGGGK